MKKSLQIMGIIVLFQPCYAQQGFVSTGLNLQSPDGSSSISMGQVNYSNYENSNGLINEGIQQPFELYQFTLLKEQDNSLTVSVFPNPASHEFTIHMSNSTNNYYLVEIYDAMGKMVLSKTTLKSIETIDIQTLSSGIYTVKIKNESNNNSTLKLIKN